MDFVRWLEKIDFSTAGLNLLVWVMFLGAGLFIWRKFWPWFTAEYFPNRIKRESERLAAHTAAETQRNGLLVSIRDALIELRVLSGQQLLLLQKQDKAIDDLSLKATVQQGEIMTRLNALSIGPGPTQAVGGA